MTTYRAKIKESGNGFDGADVGDYVTGQDGTLYRIVSTSGTIRTWVPGQSNYVYGYVEDDVDWSDVTDETEPRCSASIGDEVPPVTSDDIRALRDAAASAYDTVQRIMCDMALDGEDSQYDADCLDDEGRPDYSGGGHSHWELGKIRSALRMTQDEARAECERVIRDARAAITDARAQE